MGDFRQELANAINRYSKENGSNTPDWILAQYLEQCLAAFDVATMQRQAWFSSDRNNQNKTCEVSQTITSYE